jgi:hypothetical protein
MYNPPPRGRTTYHRQRGWDVRVGQSSESCFLLHLPRPLPTNRTERTVSGILAFLPVTRPKHVAPDSAGGIRRRGHPLGTRPHARGDGACALSGRWHPSSPRSLTVVRAGGALRLARALTSSFFARRPAHFHTSCRPSRRLRLRAASACSHLPLQSSRCRPASRCVCGARTLGTWWRCAAARPLSRRLDLTLARPHSSPSLQRLFAGPRVLCVPHPARS